LHRYLVAVADVSDLEADEVAAVQLLLGHSKLDYLLSRPMSRRAGTYLAASGRAAEHRPEGYSPFKKQIDEGTKMLRDWTGGAAHERSGALVSTFQDALLAGGVAR